MGVLLVLVLLFLADTHTFSLGGLLPVLLGVIVVKFTEGLFCQPVTPAVLDPETFNLLGRAISRSCRLDIV